MITTGLWKDDQATLVIYHHLLSPSKDSPQDFLQTHQHPQQDVLFLSHRWPAQTSDC